MGEETIKNKDIIIVGQQPWDVTIGSNCKDIALELSKHNRILYVNSPMDRITLLKHKNDPGVVKRRKVIKGKENGLLQISPNLWTLYPDVLVESINWLGNFWIFDYLNKRNNRLFAGSIQKAINVLNFKDIVLFNDSDMFKSFYLQDMLKPSVGIYYSRDFMLGVDYWKKHGEKIEPMLIAKSNLCVANSEYLTDYCKKYNPNSYYIGQGCDLRLFSGADKNPVVPEITTLEGPKIGYVGALQSSRLDIDLIAYLARLKPAYNFIFVGPEDETFRCSMLHTLPNVYFTGSKPLEALPAYINSFDICINPQLVNTLTIGNYPRKIDEYLAMGKPVVATLTNALNMFKGHIYLADSRDEFISALERALVEDTQEKRDSRQMLARSHSWKNSIAQLSQAIKKVI